MDTFVICCLCLSERMHLACIYKGQKTLLSHLRWSCTLHMSSPKHSTLYGHCSLALDILLCFADTMVSHHLEAQKVLGRPRKCWEDKYPCQAPITLILDWWESTISNHTKSFLEEFSAFLAPWDITPVPVLLSETRTKMLRREIYNFLTLSAITRHDDLQGVLLFSMP